MKRAFKIIDHTADVGIVAYGNDIEELFANAALALFSLIAEPGNVEASLRFDLEVCGNDRESLLVAWLNELIYLFDVERILFSRFEIESADQVSIKAACYGEHFDPMKHHMKTGVKAATYHMLELDRNGDGYRAQIILDI